MYRNAYQRGMLTIFFSVGSKPLNIWDVHIKDGYVTRFLDQDIKSMVLEIGGTNVSTTYITCPKDNKVLGITMPFLVMIVKNLKKYFTFEVTILDETGTRRRFRVSNFQSTTQILPLCTVMPIGLSDGWNQIQFNLAEFTRRAYKKQFVEVQKLKINANIRLRRIYFTEQLLPEDKLPPEYKLYFPLPSSSAKDKKKVEGSIQYKENVKPSTSQKLVEQTTQPDVKDEMKISKTSVHSVKKQPSQEDRKGSKTTVESLNETTEGAEKVEAEESEPPIDKLEQIAENVDVVEEVTETLAAEATEGETEVTAAEIVTETTAEIVTETTDVAETEDVAPSEPDATELGTAEEPIT